MGSAAGLPDLIASLKRHASTASTTAGTLANELNEGYKMESQPNAAEGKPL